MAGELSKLFVVIGAKTEDFEKGIQNAQASLNKLGKGMMIVGGAITALGIASIKTYAAMGDAVMKMSQRTGFTTETLSKLRFAANLSGSSLEGLEAGIKRMQRTLYDAEKGLSTATDALDALGISSAQLKGLSPEEQFMALAKALARIEDPSTKAALAMEIFGRAGTDLLPMLAEGEAGLAAMMQKAEELGLVFDEAGAKKAADFQDAMETLQGAFQGLAIAVGSELIPQLQPLIDTFTNIISKMSEWAAEHPGLVKVIAGLGLALVGGGGLIFALGKIIATLRSMWVALVAVHAMMGPGGWVKLAAGLALAGGAVFALNKLTESPETPEIPGMAGGGIVRRPMLAMLGEGGPEAVVPLGGGFGGASVVVNVNGPYMGDEMSRRELVRDIKKIFDEEERRHFSKSTKTETYGGSHL